MIIIGLPTQSTNINMNSQLNNSPNVKKKKKPNDLHEKVIYRIRLQTCDRFQIVK